MAMKRYLILLVSTDVYMLKITFTYRSRDGPTDLNRDTLLMLQFVYETERNLLACFNLVY